MDLSSRKVIYDCTCGNFVEVDNSAKILWCKEIEAIVTILKSVGDKKNSGLDISFILSSF